MLGLDSSLTCLMRSQVAPDTMTRPDGSITRLIPDVQRGDSLAIDQLWQRYVARVRGVVRPVVAGLAPGAGDEEDVAQSAFRAFFDAAANNGTVQLESRDELWRLLVTISRRKATDRVRHELRDRRGGEARRRPEGLENVTAGTPSPSEITELQDLFDHLLLALDAACDHKLKTVAVLRLEGLTNEEIAAQLNCTVRTIQRKLHILERLWASEA